MQQFRRDGFVVVDGLITDAELDDYETLVTEAVARRKRDAPPLEERGAYAQSFHQCINLWEDYPDVRPLTFHPRIGQAAAELLGVDAVRLWHDQALYKEAGGRETDPHQDHGYWPIRETDTITAWIPFRGSTIGERRDGIPAGVASRRRAQVRQHLPGRGRVGVDGPARGRAPSSRSSSKCRRARSRSTTASPCTWRSRTSPTTTAPCTR